MLPAFLLSIREGLEATLIVGIVLGAVRKIHKNEAIPVVWAGVWIAALLCLASGLALDWLGASLVGTTEVIFEGTTLLLAAGLLTWMIFWMRSQSRQLKSELEIGVSKAALNPGQRGLFLFAFIAVLREGIELTLFLTAAALTTNPWQVLAGAVLGLAVAAFLGWSLFASIISLDLGRFFLITSVLLILFAAGLVSRGVHEFNEIGWIPQIIDHIWNMNPLLDEQSYLGQVLGALFGYSGSPSLTEAMAYLGYFILVGIGLWISKAQLTHSQQS